MEAIVNKANWPKFLRVNESVKRLGYNRYLLRPWSQGEIVKVLPFEEQKSSVSGDPGDKFRKWYVSVLRKTDEGSRTLKYTWSWNIFEKITK